MTGIFCNTAPVFAGDIMDSVYFFGDSTTAHLALRGGIPKERVWSGAGNTVKFSSVNREKCVHFENGEDLTLSEAVSKVKPSEYPAEREIFPKTILNLYTKRCFFP